MEESPELLWIGTRSAGLLVAPPDFTHFKKYPLGERNALGYIRWNPSFTSLAADSLGNHWSGAWGVGFAQLDRVSGQFKYRNFQPSNRNFILSVLKDREGELWYGSLGGLNHYHPDTEESDYFPFAPEDPLSRMTSAVNALFEDSNNRLWVGTSKHGLKQFDRNNCEYLHFSFGSEDIHGTKSAAIAFIFEDSKKRVWVGTSDAGFYKFDPLKGTFKLYSSRDGLSSDGLSGMVEDSEGNLWIASGKGLSKFNPQEGSFRNYDIDDGLPSNSLSTIYRGPYTGRIFLGTQGKGFAVFHPDSLADNSYVPPVVISSLQRFRRQGEEMVVLEEGGISGRKLIKLSHRDNIVTFQVAALSYRKSAKNQYAYLLEGFNDQWIPLGTRREITFTNLDPGRYTLRVKASNGDGLWNEEGTYLKIRVFPPWYASGWAYIIYFALGAAAVRGVYRFQLSRKLAGAEASRLKELDAFKSRFFTNITHEFRTPLTVISGMAAQIREDPTRWAEEGTEMIRRNSDQLLGLVTQMLDLAKLESGSLPLKMQQGDILVFLKYLLESFHSLASSKQIQLEFETDLEELIMDYDPEKIQQIVSNLLSNAIKFTPEGGVVKLLVSRSETTRPSLLLQVSDTGMGIPEDKLPFIFDRFYQVEEEGASSAPGAGIGLALTKELVRLLDGAIEGRKPGRRGLFFRLCFP
ncbi:MAG: hypothetical protein IPH04_09045 [Saprospirales bacterium]|nr:hypothetical protein [Saprospirales bacterium]